MLRLTVLVMVVLGLSGCPGPICGCAGNGFAPSPSNVIEDANGQKYFVVSEVTADSSVTPPKALYAWDAGAQTWVKQTTFASSASWNELFIDQAGDIWLNNVGSSDVSTPVVQINPQTLQVTNHSLGINQFLVNGDQAVEYQGSLVNSYQPSTGASVFLYNLPTVTAAAQAMGLSLNAQPYKMLCMPVLKYDQWDGQTHYCEMANDVFYIGDFLNAPMDASNGSNDVIAFMVSIANAGNTYQLIDRFQTPIVVFLQYPPAQENFAADFPAFSALMKVECGGTVDKQGNYHQFCDDTGDYTKFTYRFYDKAAPTTPLYTQVLP